MVGAITYLLLKSNPFGHVRRFLPLVSSNVLPGEGMGNVRVVMGEFAVESLIINIIIKVRVENGTDTCVIRPWFSVLIFL